MARNSPPEDGPPQGRFSRYGHTSHRQPPPAYPPHAQPTARIHPTGGGFDPPTYHHTYPPGPAAPQGKVTVTRAIAQRSNQMVRGIAHKVISASKADGADESGLTALIWNQVLSYGTDAMITVALAGTVFFGASADAKRGNVLLYLLVTLAPFAVVAPVIGPTLDRLQHGRRWAMAATAIGRGVLAVIMAGHPTNLLVLYPCALGSLVLSKAYSVIRAAAAPRLVPRGLTLVEANARLSIFGLGSALVGGALVGAVIKVTGSYSLGLYLTAIAFGVCGYFAFRLPKQVDATPAEHRRTERAERQAMQRAPVTAGPFARLGRWARRGLEPQVITAMQGESTLRFLAGFLTIFLAFYIEATSHGFDAAFGLGAIGVGAGAGNFLGNAIGTRLKVGRPERLILFSCTAAATMCLLTALLFGLGFAVLCMFVACVVNSFSKIALDAVIQRDVPEALRSSAFGRSETFLQLSWVFGAAIGVLLPSKHGGLGMWVAAGIVGAVTVLIALRGRAMRRATADGGTTHPTGSLAPDSQWPR